MSLRGALLGVLAAGLWAGRARAESGGGGEDYTTTVVGARSEEKSVDELEDAAISTDIISRDEIEASGASDLATLLQQQGGVAITRGLGGSAVELMGLGPEYTVILVDGQRVVGRVDGTLDLARLGLERVERIEIIKGPASAVYGADALAGVINIVTRRAPAHSTGEGSLRYGEGSLLELGVGGGVRRGALGVRVGVSMRRRDAWDRHDENLSTDGSALGEISADARVEWRQRGPRKLRVTTTAEYLRRDQQGVDAAATGAIFDTRNLTETASLRVNPEWKLGRRTRMSVTLYGTMWRDQLLDDQRNSAELDTTTDSREVLAQLEASVDHSLGRHRVVVGGEAALGQLSSPRLGAGEGGSGRGALFAEDRWVVLPRRVTLLPAARLELDSTYGVHGTPRLAGRWDASGHWVVRGSVGLGFRAPSFKERLLLFENPGAGYVIEGNPDLEPETSISETLAVEWRQGKVLRVSVGGFRNDLENLITTVSNGGSGEALRFTYANIGTAHTQGLELGLRVRWRVVSAELGYTYTDAVDSSESEPQPLEGRAAHRANAQVTLRARWGGSMTTRVALVGPRPYFVDDDGNGTLELFEAATYATIDGRAGYDLSEDSSVFAGVDNLTDAGDTRFTTLPPRMLYAGVTAKF